MEHRGGRNVKITGVIILRIHAFQKNQFFESHEHVLMALSGSKMEEKEFEERSFCISFVLEKRIKRENIFTCWSQLLFDSVEINIVDSREK